MTRSTWTLFGWVLVVACGGTAPPGDADASIVPDAGDAGALPSGPDAGQPPGEDASVGRDAGMSRHDGCTAEDLAYSRTEAEVDDAIALFLDGLRASGADRAYLRERSGGTAAPLAFVHIDRALGVPASDDPRPALLAWLERVPASPFRAAEYAPDPARVGAPSDTAMNDFYRAYMLREHIEGVPFPASVIGVPGFEAMIARRADGWVLEHLNVFFPWVAFAERDDAEMQSACAPVSTPPEDLVRGAPFTGLEFAGCAEVGTYSYVPTEEDVIAWRDLIAWRPGLRSPERATWVPVRIGELTVHPSNHWPRIGYADCYCDGQAGWTLEANAITGERLQVRPGILCVVC